MRNRKGMTLVEVIVAMALFAIVMVTVFPAFLITNMMNNVSKEFMDANYYATQELEEIYNMGKTLDLLAITDKLEATRGFACDQDGDTGIFTCTKTANGVTYHLTLDYFMSLLDLIDVNIAVEVTTGDYAGDRSVIQNYIRVYFDWGD